MPELAEIKIMAEYINDSCQHEDFTSILVSPAVEKRLSLVQPSNLQVFNISAESRGKELLLKLSSGADQHLISASMGMSGHWILCGDQEVPKHAHLLFKTPYGKYLCLVDPRRFARWKWSSGWSENRGPCPLTQTVDFMKNIVDNLHKPRFRNPIHLMLMDQQYFNGIGNYLRAEILFRANQDPFEEARTALVNNSAIVQLCSQVPFEAYLIGGGQLKDWQNPFSVPAGGFRDWIKCYGKADTHIKDYNGRTFWYFQSQIKQAV
jgi:endonuclease VIII-like 1